MINRYCENCGKILNKSTLICDACGTDYNDYPKCEHIYSKYMIEPVGLDNTVNIHFKCAKCKETISLKCEIDLLINLARGKEGGLLINFAKGKGVRQI